VIYRWSRHFIPTLRADPAEVDDAGLRVLLRAGYVRRGPGGNPALLPLARRTLRRIVQIIRTEMDAAGAQEIYSPTVQHPLQLARELRSYKELPQIWYQFQSNLESYSIDLTPDARSDSFRTLEQTFRRILDKCDVEYVSAGSRLMVSSETGPDILVRGHNYAAHIDDAVAIARTPGAPDLEGDLQPEEFSTPNVKTIAEIAAFTALPETSQIKSLVFVADGMPVMALLRGDHQLCEAKLAAVLDAAELRIAKRAEMRDWFGTDAGSLGPVGVRGVPIFADEALRGRRNMICGANKNDFHFRSVTPGEDFEAHFGDLRQVEPGDRCITDGGPLTFEKASEIAYVSDMPSKNFDLHVTDEYGHDVTPLIGSHLLQLERLLLAIAQQNYDKDGLILPSAIAPFAAIVTPVFYADASQRDAAARICADAEIAGVDVLLDDRDERPAVKFKDADLTGIPYRINIGKKLAQGFVEVVERRSKQVSDVSLANCIQHLKEKALAQAQRARAESGSRD